MSTYSELTTSVNLSGLASAINGQFAAVRSLERGSSSPSVTVTGLLWEKTDYSWTAGMGSAIMRFNGSAFALLIDPRSPQINAGGTVAMAADLAMGSNKITGLSDGSASDDAATVGQVATLAGSSWSNHRDAAGYRLDNLGTATASDQSAARYDDTWQTTHGLGRYIDAVTFNTGGSGELNSVGGGKRTVPNTAVTFCPRVIVLTLGGQIRTISGSTLLDTVPRRTIIATRLNADSGYVVQGSISIGGGSETIFIEIQWETSSPRGFRIRARRSSNNQLCTVGTAAAMCQSAVGFA